jgi:hypothetical protein
MRSTDALGDGPSMGEPGVGDDAVGGAVLVSDGGDTDSPLHAVASTTSAVAQIARRITEA